MIRCFIYTVFAINGLVLTFAMSAAIRGCQEWTPTVHVIHSGTIKER